MTLYFCPYLGKQIPENQTDEDHIIALGLGGSDKFTVRSSRKANSLIGSYIDAPFLKTPIVAMQVHSVGVTDREGRPHVLMLEAETELHGRRQRILVSHTVGQKKLRHELLDRKIVDIDPHSGRQRIQLTVPPDEVSETVKKLEERFRKRGKTIEFLPPKLDVKENPEIVATLELDYKVLARQYVRIAIGAAALTFGESFSRSQSAEELRTLLWEKKVPPSTELDAVISRSWPNTEIIAPMQYLFRDTEHMVLLHRLGSQVWCHMVLLGRMSGNVLLAQGFPEWANRVGDGIVYNIDPVRRTCSRSDLIERLGEGINRRRQGATLPF